MKSNARQVERSRTTRMSISAAAEVEKGKINSLYVTRLPIYYRLCKNERAASSLRACKKEAPAGFDINYHQIPGILTAAGVCALMQPHADNATPIDAIERGCEIAHFSSIVINDFLLLGKSGLIDFSIIESIHPRTSIRCNFM